MSQDKQSYSAAIIIIGNEILSGRTVDKNTNWLALRLIDLGIKLAEVRVIPDIRQKIIDTIHELRDGVDYIFTTGGIGPTHDDITAESVAGAFGVDVVQDERAYKLLLDHYGAEAELTPARLKMAMLPEGADIIDNPVSGAPGFKIGNVYVMAGVPRIMQGMFDHIAPSLTGGPPVASVTVECALPESVIADDLNALQDQYPQVDMGSYPNYQHGVFSTSLVLRCSDEDLLAKAAEAVRAMVARHNERNVTY